MVDIAAAVSEFPGVGPLAGMSDAWKWSAGGFHFAVALSPDGGHAFQLNGRDTWEPELAVAALTWRSGEPTGTGLAQVYVIDHPLGQRAAALELMLLPNAVLALDTSIGVGECRVDRPRADPGTIVLRDAGEVAVEADMGVTVLDSSWLPEGSLDISGVAYAGSAERVVAVGLAGTFVSRDGGDSWTQTDTVAMNSVRCAGTRCFAVGPRGRVAVLDSLP